MNRNESRELREQRMKIAHQMSELATAGLKTPEDRQKFAAMDKEQDELRQRIEQVEKAAAIAEELRGTGRPPAGQPGSAEDPDAAKTMREKYTRAFRSYLMYGAREEGSPAVGGRMSDEERRLVLSQWDRSGDRERRDMGSGGQGAYPGATTGFFVPVGFVDRVTEALKYYGPMLMGGQGLPTIMDTDSGQPLPFPTDNDTTVSGEQVGEGQQVTTQDVSISQITFGAWKYSTKLVKVSIELMQDSAFDLEAYLIKKFATRTGRILNTKFTTGAGTTEPNGIVTAATSGGTAVGASGNDGGSETGGTTIGSDDLVTLEHSVDPLYRRGARFMMHDATLAAIKKVKDKYGRMLWMPGLAAATPDTINGYPFLINNDMAQIAVNNKTVLFGDMSLYTIRRVKQMSVLRLEERFADYGQIAFIGFSRYDGNLLDAGTHPVKYLVQAAS